MLNNIPPSRLLLYIALIGLLPFCILLSVHFSRQSQLTTIEENLNALNMKARLKEKKQAQNLAVQQSFRDADHFYIDKYLETLDFLEPELENLQRLASKPYFADDEALKKRLEFLQGSSNKLIFTEGVVQSYPFFQETMETLVHPVEVNAEDVQKILAHIEGTEIGSFQPAAKRPQLIITDFKLERRSNPDKNEVFLLNMKLLKREFL